jgi:energy-coupling factor transporter ATP-binding protein EcfA2
MQLERFRVQNVRSIEDSGWVDMGPRLTIMVGKNGSGKTAILESLGSLQGQNWALPDDATPLWNNSATPGLTIQCSISKDEIDALADEIKVAWTRNDRSALRSGLEIAITRSGYGVRSIDGKLNKSALFRADSKARAAARNTALLAFAALRKVAGNIKIKISLSTKSEWTDFRDVLSQYESALRLRAASSVEIQKALASFRSAYEAFYQSHMFLRLRDAVARKVPRFELLARTDLPNDVEIASSELPKSRFFSNVCKAAGVAPKDLSEMSSVARRTVSLAASRYLTELVVEYWRQDSLEIRIDFSPSSVSLVAIINGTVYGFEQLSTGTAWFLDFLIHVGGLLRGEQCDLLLLLDEPGQDLHPTAQREVARWLSTVSQHFPILYSTHSPYLFSAARLDQIRPVLKRHGRTEVENSLFCSEDAETLSPVLDVIGLPVRDADSISLTQRRNVIGEGPSDYHYLSTMQRVLRFEPKVSVIPCVGVTRTQHIASILQGWGIPYLVVVDNDREGQRVERAIKRYGVDSVMAVSEVAGEAIEDLFEEEDFDRAVLSGLEFDRKPNERNSVLAARLPGGKRGLARRFSERIEDLNITFGNESIERFRRLFEMIDRRFSQA